MSKSYFSWWWKNIFYPKVKFWNVYFWRNLFDGCEDFLYRLSHDGNRNYDQWELSAALAKRYLQISRSFTEDPMGHPIDLEKEREGGDDYQAWKSILTKIRFSMFIHLFIHDDLFGHLIDSPSDRKHCSSWARKKYPYISDLLSDSYFEMMYPDSSLKWKLKLKFGSKTSEDNPKLSQLTFSYKNKETGEVVPREEAPPEAKFNFFDLYEVYKAQYREGLDLMSKYWGVIYGIRRK